MQHSNPMYSGSTPFVQRQKRIDVIAQRAHKIRAYWSAERDTIDYRPLVDVGQRIAALVVALDGAGGSYVVPVGRARPLRETISAMSKPLLPSIASLWFHLTDPEFDRKIWESDALIMAAFHHSSGIRAFRLSTAGAGDALADLCF